VYRFEQRWRDGERRGFEIECSSGTYVRSLIADLGDAYCEQLRRTRIGSFDVAAADPDRPVAINQALDFLPEVALDAEQATRAAHGARVRSDRVASGFVRLTLDGELVALAQPGPEPGELRPVVGLRG
jgi:tRNA pseudouridine55 synthase